MKLAPGVCFGCLGPSMQNTTRGPSKADLAAEDTEEEWLPKAPGHPDVPTVWVQVMVQEVPDVLVAGAVRKRRRTVYDQNGIEMWQGRDAGRVPPEFRNLIPVTPPAGDAGRVPPEFRNLIPVTPP